jgi:hypothetical protein
MLVFGGDFSLFGEYQGQPRALFPMTKPYEPYASFRSAADARGEA